MSHRIDEVAKTLASAKTRREMLANLGSFAWRSAIGATFLAAFARKASAATCTTCGQYCGTGGCTGGCPSGMSCLSNFCTCTTTGQICCSTGACATSCTTEAGCGATNTCSSGQCCCLASGKCVTSSGGNGSNCGAGNSNC